MVLLHRLFSPPMENLLFPAHGTEPIGSGMSKPAKKSIIKTQENDKKTKYQDYFSMKCDTGLLERNTPFIFSNGIKASLVPAA